MQAAAAPPLPPPRRRVYTAVDPRSEWRSTEDADTLVVDVSGFRKEELKVLYNTRRKLKVTGERQPDGVPRLKVTGERQVDGGRWARFLKVFPVPRSCDAGTIEAKLDTESAQLLVILPKPKGSSSSSKDKQKEHHPERSKSLEELMRAETADGSSDSGGSMWSAQEDPGSGKAEDKEQKPHHQAMEEPRKDQVMNIQDLPRGDGDATENAARNDGDAATENAVRNNDDDGKGEDGRWWRKIRVLHVLLVLALVGVGATILYIVLL